MNPQTQASNPNISAFVMASAGTGKTKMLVDRLTRLLLRGVNLSAILCLTFTKAAAQEMVHRLFQRLELYAKMDDSALLLELDQLEEDRLYLQKAKNLYFELLDKQHTLKIKTIHSFCQSILENYAFEVGIIPPFQLIDDEQKKTMIERSLDQCAGDIEPFTHFMGYTTFVDYVECALSLSDDALLNSLESLPLPQTFDNIKNLCQELPNHFQADISPNMFLTKDGDIRKRIFKKAELDKYPGLDDIAQRIAQAFQNLQDQEKTNHINALNKTFFTLIQNVKTLYAQEKQKHSMLDFDDLIIKTNQLLKNTPTLEQKLGYSIDAILLDEAQDTSNIQWQVLTTLTECMLLQDKPHCSLFVVGDLKQSIYSFQGAEPALFLEKQEEFKILFDHYQKPFKVLTLQKSFRCSKKILETVDTVFNKNPDGLFLKEPLLHIPSRSEEGHIYIHPTIMTDKITTWQPPHLRADPKGLPHAILQCVENILQKGYAPKDILILVRSRAPFVDTLIKLFSMENIPCSGLDRFLLKDHPMTQDLLNLCEWLCNKSYTFNLFHILKTFCGMTDIALFDMLQHEKDLWKVLNPEDPFVIFLKECLSKVDYTPLTELLSFIWYHQKKYFIGAYGLEAQAIYETFYDYTYKIEQEKSASLQQLVWTIKSQDHEVKRDVSSTALNQVRLLTVHGSKGLEAPIVILADTNFRQTLQKERLMRYNGRYLIKPSDADCPTFLKSAKENALSLLKAEEKRLLYVALTRARDGLYIFGKGEPIQDSWYDLLHPHIDRDVMPSSTCLKGENKQIKDEPSIDIPDYFYTPLERIEKDIPKNKQATERGILIHTIIEQCACVPFEQRHLFLNKQDISSADKENILWFFEHCAPLLSGDYFFELPLIDNGQLLRVDLFIKNEVDSVIIDFKTGKRNLEKVEIYTKQLTRYKQALMAIYPNINVKLYIAWLDERFLEEL